MLYTVNGNTFDVELSITGYLVEKSTGKYIHRIIAEKKFNRKLYRWEVVHHIDGNKLNNDPKNLYVCYWEFHNLIHENKITKENFWEFVYDMKSQRNIYSYAICK